MSKTKILSTFNNNNINTNTNHNNTIANAKLSYIEINTNLLTQ